MKIEFLLDTREKQRRKKGFPICIRTSGGGKPLLYLCRKGLVCEIENWDEIKKEPKTNKNDILFLRKQKTKAALILSKIELGEKITSEEVKSILLDKKEVSCSKDFFEFSNIILGELKIKVDTKGVSAKGNLRSNENAIKQLKKFRKELKFTEIDYSFLKSFLNWQLSIGNEKSTINTYLRKYRAIYNQAVLRKHIEDLKPFKDIFKEVSVKANRTKNRYLTKAVIKVLETIEGLPDGQQQSLDYFLLQFYFGGQDFKDIYFLENNQIANDRVFFTRGKLGDKGYQFDLKIFEKAKIIISKYQCKGRYLLPGRKDYDGYNTFLRKTQKNLVIIQKKQEALGIESQKINVMPLGGNLSLKVSRHTFSTIATHLFIDPDMLRQLMGHERNDVDTIYKDKFPENIRDEWHYKIIHLVTKLTRQEAITQLKDAKYLFDLEIITLEEFTSEKNKLTPFILK